MDIGRRLQLSGPDFDKNVAWWSVSGGHGGDEYGNCSLYFRCALFGVVFFHDPHFQRDVLLPDPGECEWIDRKYCGDWEEMMAMWRGRKPSCRVCAAGGCDSCKGPPCGCFHDAEVTELTAEEGRALFDKAAREELGISGDEFLHRLDAGEYADCGCCPDGVFRLRMLEPFAR